MPTRAPDASGPRIRAQHPPLGRVRDLRGLVRAALAKVEALPKFEHFGGTKARLGLALGIAYDELAKMG